MGNSPTKKDQVQVSYKYQLRKEPLSFKIFDDFPYPKKPKNVEIEDQFQDILKNCILTKEQIEQIKDLTFILKWKLICKHRFMILTGLCDYRQAKKSISQFYVESIKNSNSMLDLDHFYSWLTKEAKEPDINSFLNYGGLNILLDLLQNAEICSRSTKNHAKQILILKILGFLKNFPQIVEKLVTIPDSATKIFTNFNFHNWELSKYVLQLLNDYIWKGEEGRKDVIQAFNNYKNEFNLRYRFEPFIEILGKSKNIIMLENVLGFINALIEAPEEEQQRSLVRSEFSGCGIKNLTAVIKERIEKEEYKLEDCTYKAYLEECQENEFSESAPINQEGGSNTSRTTIFFGDNEEDLFTKKQINVLKQIEILENGFLEGMEDMDQDSECSDSFGSFMNEGEDDILANEDGVKPTPRSLRSLTSLKNKEIDFSDVSEIFNRIRTKSLENENYEDLLAIMQNMCLIPTNENGKKVWKKVREAFDEMTGLGKGERIMDLGKLRKMIDTQEKLVDLQNKITFLTTQLTIRDDEIKQLHFKIKDAEFTKQTYKSSNEQIIKTLLQEKETNKTLSSRIVEIELRSAKMIKEREEKIKRLDEKVKELSRNLSYTPRNPASLQPSPQKTQPPIFNKSLSLEVENLNLRQELENLKKTLSSSKNNTSPQKPPLKPAKTDKDVETLKLPLKPIFEKDESRSNSEQSFRYSGASTQTQNSSIGVQTEETSPNPSKEFLIDDPKTNLEILPSFNNNLTNIQEIIANAKDDPVGKMLQKSMENIENEMLQSLKKTTIVNLEDSGILYRRHANSNMKNKDQIIDNLTKRIKELENMINNIPNRVSGKEERTPKSILRNMEGDHGFRSRGTTHASMKSIQFKMDDNPDASPRRNRTTTIDDLVKNKNFGVIKEDEKENRGSMIYDFGPRKKSTAITAEQLKDEIVEPEEKNNNLIIPPPPPPNIGGPPPLASLFNKVQEGPIKEKKAPKVPMKQICWTCVNPNKIEYTVWERINESEVPYDPEELEKNFTSKRPEKKQESAKINNPNVKVTLLSLTRSKNISIALSKLKMSLSAISEAAYRLDQNVLKLNVVGSLLEACPKEEEINLVSSYEGDRAQLDLPEQFVLEIKNVPGFRLRLEAMQFFMTYKELVEDFSLKTEKLTDLFENMLDNDKFQILLKYTLALGNYFNGTGQRGGAFGFKLDAFDKLVDIKSVDGKKSFLGYMIELIEKNTGEIFIDSNEDLKIYDIGRKLPISQLILDLNDIKKGLGIVSQAIQTKSTNPFDNVEYFFSDFERVLKTNIQEFEYMIEELDCLYSKICEFYCEDPNETPSDQFVEKVFKIWTACKKAKMNIVKEKEMMKKEELRMKKIEEKAKVQNNSYKLECPEELANYIKQRRMVRRRPDFEMRKNGSMIKPRSSIKQFENPGSELTKK